MKWDITITPQSPALDEWRWAAVRADQENVIMGDQTYTSVSAARTSAQAAVQEYEDTVMVMRDATVTEEFIPDGVEVQALKGTK